MGTPAYVYQDYSTVVLFLGSVGGCCDFQLQQLNCGDVEAASRQQHSDQRQDGKDNGVGFGKEGKTVDYTVSMRIYSAKVNVHVM